MITQPCSTSHSCNKAADKKQVFGLIRLSITSRVVDSHNENSSTNSINESRRTALLWRGNVAMKRKTGVGFLQHTWNHLVKSTYSLFLRLVYRRRPSTPISSPLIKFYNLTEEILFYYYILYIALLLLLSSKYENFNSYRHNEETLTGTYYNTSSSVIIYIL